MADETIECGEGKNKHLLLLAEPGNLKQILIEFLKWDGGEGSRAYDAHKYLILRNALRTLVADGAAPTQHCELCSDEKMCEQISSGRINDNR